MKINYFVLTFTLDTMILLDSYNTTVYSEHWRDDQKLHTEDLKQASYWLSGHPGPQCHSEGDGQNRAPVFKRNGSLECS